MHCALVSARHDGRRGDALPLVVALHRRGADAGAALAFARRLFGDAPDVVALQAARPCNPFQSNLRANAAYAGFSWYLGDDPGRPEAASFGDSLAQIDAFVRGLEVPFVLTGEGQGAVLAWTLAQYAPRGLRGVFAAGAKVPEIAGWEAPAAPPADDAFLVEEAADPLSWLQSRAGPGKNGPCA